MVALYLLEQAQRSSEKDEKPVITSGTQILAPSSPWTLSSSKPCLNLFYSPFKIPAPDKTADFVCSQVSGVYIMEHLSFARRDLNLLLFSPSASGIAYESSSKPRQSLTFTLENASSELFLNLR